MTLADVRFSAYLVASNRALSLPGHAFRVGWARRVCRFSVGRGCALERGVRITSNGGVRIGENTNVNRGVVLDGRGGLRIGSRVNISDEAAILTADHDPQSPDFVGRLRPVVIGDRVWIATRAIVLPGSTVGEGALIAAGAVVHGEVPAGVIVAGNPATPVGKRNALAQTQLVRYARYFH